MAYNRENYLKRVLMVQEIYNEHHSKGVNNEYIFKHYIEPIFLISIATFYNYLAVNAKRDIKKINTNKVSTSKKKRNGK
jgi:hypothetical protein